MLPYCQIKKVFNNDNSILWNNSKITILIFIVVLISLLSIVKLQNFYFGVKPLRYFEAPLMLIDL